MTAGNSETQIGRTGFGETGSFTAEQGASTVYGESYVRDDSGRITGKTETRGATATTYVYGYDAADRLDKVTRDGVEVESYTYDANGNRNITAGGAPITHNAQDQIATVGAQACDYTPAGELRYKPDGTTYEYDSLGALTKVTRPVGGAIDYTVDSGGRRIAEGGASSTRRRFLYGRGLGPVAELTSAHAVKSRFIYATHSNVPDLTVQGSTTYRIVTEQVGSPRAVVNVATGAVVQEMDYDAFGRVTRDTNAGFQPFGFAGGLYDQDTKLVRFGARDYDPETGRFLAPDPLRFGGGGTNLYGYALADPVNLTDPTGQILDTILDIGFIAYDLYKIGKVADERVRGRPVGRRRAGRRRRRRADPVRDRRRRRRADGPRSDRGRLRGDDQGRSPIRRPVQQHRPAARGARARRQDHPGGGRRGPAVRGDGRQDGARGRRAAAHQRAHQRRRRVGPGHRY